MRGTLILLHEEPPSCLDLGLLKGQRTQGDISKVGDIEEPSPHFSLETLKRPLLKINLQELWEPGSTMKRACTQEFDVVGNSG